MLTAKQMNWLTCPVETENNPIVDLSYQETVEFIIYRAMFQGRTSTKVASKLIDLKLSWLLSDLGYGLSFGDDYDTISWGG